MWRKCREDTSMQSQVQAVIIDNVSSVLRDGPLNFVGVQVRQFSPEISAPQKLLKKKIVQGEPYGNEKWSKCFLLSNYSTILCFTLKKKFLLKLLPAPKKSCTGGKGAKKRSCPRKLPKHLSPSKIYGPSLSTYFKSSNNDPCMRRIHCITVFVTCAWCGPSLQKRA